MTEAVIEQPAAAPAAPAAAAAGAPAAPAAAPAAPSALAKPVPLHERIPEKFHVKRAGEKGEEFDAEASTAKVLEAYKALEQKLGSGDAPPKAPEEYTITPPEAMKDTWKEDGRTAAFRKDAHAAGLNQKQFDFVMGRYFNTMPELAKQIVQDRADVVVQNLEKAWGDKYDGEFNAAFKAFEQLAGPDLAGKFDDIMTNPAIAYQLLARVGKEMQEPGSIPRDTGGTGETDVQALLTDPVLQNPKHPEYAAKRAKLDAHYAKKYGTAPAN